MRSKSSRLSFTWRSISGLPWPLQKDFGQAADVRAPGHGHQHAGGPGPHDLNIAFPAEFHVRSVEAGVEVPGQVELLARLLAVIVARYAIPVEDRLDLGQVAEVSRRAVPGRQLARPPPHGQRRGVVGGGAEPILVAADAAGLLARPRDRAAPHRLHEHALLVEQLEVDELVGRHGEVGAAVGLDGHGAEDGLVVEVVPGHARRLLPGAAVPAGPRPEAFLGRLDDAELLDRAPLDLVHARALIHVGHVEVAFRLAEIDARGDDRGPGPRSQRPGVEAPRAFDVHQDLVSEDVQQVDPHLLALRRVIREQRKYLAESG